MVFLRPSPFLILVSALFLSPGCSSGDPGSVVEETISREAFIEAYLELRVVALRSVGQEVNIAQRDEILEAKGLTEADLLGFVEVWGEDADFWNGVWGEVSSRLQEIRRIPGDPEEGGDGREAGR